MHKKIGGTRDSLPKNYLFCQNWDMWSLWFSLLELFQKNVLNMFGQTKKMILKSPKNLASFTVVIYTHVRQKFVACIS